MEFTKIQGAGNDFILVEDDGRREDWAPLAEAMCHRRFGIGGDGLLVLLPSEKADVGMRIFNADGSESAACGNGIRCLALYAFEKGRVPPGKENITVETSAGIRQISLEQHGGKLRAIRANLGRPQFLAGQIPFLPRAGVGGIVDIKGMLAYHVSVEGLDLALNLVSMGNPHAVNFLAGPVADFPLADIGPLVEHLPAFPSRANFEVARVLGSRHLEARVWERGVGETLACGSGACAIAVASRLHGLTEARVDIDLPGGTLNVEWNAAGEVILGGPTATVFEGQWPD